ncbi:MAG: hypothetical protein HY092_02410 [Candidatus Kerfeldbacteria bacterium]|nr:hypothetical protein [Candidatus Kerfeldbacteria bacterium]
MIFFSPTNKRLDDWYRSLPRAGMTSSERDRLATSVQQFQGAHPLPLGSNQPTVMFRQLLPWGTMLALIVLIGGFDIALAADQALPGQVLYPIRRKVNEPVWLALSPNALTRTTKQIAQVDRRLKEAEHLAQQQALTPAWQDTLSKAVAVGVAKIADDANNQSVTKSHDQLEAAQFDIETVLSTHEAGLHQLQVPADKATVGALLKNVQHQRHTVIAHYTQAVGQAVREAREDVGKKSTLPQSDQAEISSRLNQAKQLLAESEQALAHDHDAQALTAAHQAERLVFQATTIAKESKKQVQTMNDKQVLKKGTPEPSIPAAQKKSAGH